MLGGLQASRRKRDSSVPRACNPTSNGARSAPGHHLLPSARGCAVFFLGLVAWAVLLSWRSAGSVCVAVATPRSTSHSASGLAARASTRTATCPLRTTLTSSHVA
eukprot:8365688-Pyramimonas_sp.AAC.1